MSQKRVSKTKTPYKKKSSTKQTISKESTDWKSMISRLWELFREESKVKDSRTYMSKQFQREDLKKVHAEMKPLQQKLFKLYLPKPLTKEFGWSMQPFYNPTAKETYMFFMDDSRVVAYIPKLFEGTFDIGKTYPISLEKVERYIKDAEFLGMGYVPLDDSTIGLDYLKPLLEASKKIGFKEIRIAGAQMPIKIEHKKGIIAIAPRIVDEGVDHSDKLPNAVRQREVQLESKIEMSVYRAKTLDTNTLLSELKEDELFGYLPKRDLLKRIDGIVSKSKNLKFVEGEKKGIIPKTKSKIIDRHQIPEAPKTKKPKAEPNWDLRKKKAQFIDKLIIQQDLKKKMGVMGSSNFWVRWDTAKKHDDESFADYKLRVEKASTDFQKSSPKKTKKVVDEDFDDSYLFEGG